MIQKNYPYLKNSNFLKQFTEIRVKEKFVKITLLNWDEEPIKEIQGQVTGGSFNKDGNSAIRRNGNLSMIFEDVNDIDNIFAINKKIFIEIGYTNNSSEYKDYPIIWYPEGIFVIQSPSFSHSSSGTTVSLRISDKMCLLNGECGGVLPASVQFDEYDTVDINGEIVREKPTIHQIIQELVNHFGNEQLGKIIISDIDTRAKKVMKWVGGGPLYLVRDGEGSYRLEATPQEQYEKIYQYGEDVGFEFTDFYYPSELVANAGDTVTSVLDKIKNTLGNYEYFYDKYGNFVFQEKKNYLNTSYSTIELNKMNKEDYFGNASKGKSEYDFSNGNIITSYSNNPQYNKIKNDFVVWGIKKGIDGAKDKPIRYHLAIDKLPQIGESYQYFSYIDPDDELTKAKMPIKLPREKFPETGMYGLYYLDTNTNTIYTWRDGTYEIVDAQLKTITPTDWRTILYLQGTQAEPLAIDSGYYYTELTAEWPKVYDINNNQYFDEYQNNPSNLDFYLDIIDTPSLAKISVENIGRRTQVISKNEINCVFEADIPNYVIIEAGTEETEEKRRECEAKGQPYIQVDSSIFASLNLGGSMNSAYNEIRAMLNEVLNASESITIQTIPVHFLEPNTRITVDDDSSNIHGDYIISTISVPLDVNGTMSISASRAQEKI